MWPLTPSPNPGATTAPSPTSTARAEVSCSRCHGRKKRCDRTLPECNACKNAAVPCSFLADNKQAASFSIAYVRGLEERVAELEQLLLVITTTTTSARTTTNTTTPPPPPRPPPPLPPPPPPQQHEPTDAVPLSWDLMAPFGLGSTTPPQQEHGLMINHDSHISPSRDSADSLGEETKLLSLEATAERHLGSSSGVPFANLTQSVLRRLAPGQEAFTFEQTIDEYLMSDQLYNSDLFLSLNNMMSNQYRPALSLPSPNGRPADVPSAPQNQDHLHLTSLDKLHTQHLVGFYFAHSHTLYPIVRQDEFKNVLWRIYANPHDPVARSPLWQFRIWMVLAIGSTAHSSVSLVDETESVTFFNQAMAYFESVLGCGDMAALEALMLQVSYSFFNQMGPNTWFLVGLAVRLAVGMGLHTSSTYSTLPVHVAEHNKRIFWSLYMMDRMVSIASGRPFAMCDSDIDVEPFTDAEDDQIKPEGIIPKVTLQPSSMAVTCHILALRRIASEITNRVHSTTKPHQPGSGPKPEVENGEEILQSLHKRLIEWRRAMPFPLPHLPYQVPHMCTNWFDLNYYLLVMMLYRPSPLFPTITIPKIGILAEASAMAIRQAVNMHRQQRFAYNWLNLSAVFTSTVSLMYATTVHPDNLSMVLKRTKALDDLDLATELLDAFGKKFASAKKLKMMVGAVITRLKIHAEQ